MNKETHFRALAERLMKSTMTTVAPTTGHQAAADLYNAMDAYTDAVNANNLGQARRAAEKLAIEAMRVWAAYEAPALPEGIDQVRVENTSSVKNSAKA